MEEDGEKQMKDNEEECWINNQKPEEEVADQRRADLDLLPSQQRQQQQQILVWLYLLHAAEASGPQLVLWLKCSSTVALVRSNTHCWLGDDGSQVFMKTRRSLGLLSMQLLLTGWYRLLSFL